jgi:hypothetical protein
MGSDEKPEKDKEQKAIQAVLFFVGVGGIIFVAGFAFGFLVRGCGG